jgi:putative hemolysin
MGIQKRLVMLAMAAVAVVAVLASGCIAASGQDEGRISGNGTITYIDLEGGFYGIVGDDGEQYLPLDLDRQYQVDGMRVAFTAETEKDTVTIQQWGTPIRVLSLEEIEASGRISGNGTITYVDLEGGFFGIVTDGGEQYLPLNLDENVSVDGMRVAFKAEIREDIVTIQQWGTPVEIIMIQQIPNVTLIAGNGTVTYFEFEGGFYGIVGDDEGRYLPLNLNETFAVNGTRVVFIAEEQKDIMTIQMWGIPVKVLAMDAVGNTTYVAGNGTVTYVDLEGGFYGIVGDDGEQYLPLNLDENVSIDGLRILFAAEVEEVATIQQWGVPVTIIDIPWTEQLSPKGLVGMADPAAVYCIEMGYTYETRKNPDGSEYGVCIMQNGTVVDAWEFYRQNH